MAGSALESAGPLEFIWRHLETNPSRGAQLGIDPNFIVPDAVTALNLAAEKPARGIVTLGIGIDIIEVARIAASYERFGDRFAQRLLLPGEIAYCLTHRNPAPFLAARFAAKEAIAKAFGTGIGAALGWRDLEIRRKPSGEPFPVLHGKGQTLFDSRGAKQLRVSLSHTEYYAAAVAILED